MKFVAFVAMFAFLAVQFSQSAPTPDEEKKDTGVAPAVVAPSDPVSQSVSESKSGTPEAVASPAEASPHAEEKKA